MYECPNCAGNLKFDIARQQLYCGYCGTRMDPYSFEKERDAEESSFEWSLKPAKQTTELAMLPILLFAAAFHIAGRRGRSGDGSGKRPFGGGHFREKWPVLIKPLIGILFAFLILFLDPVSDWFYYIGALGCMGTVFAIDMDNRNIWIHSDGAVYQVVTKGYADTVTDNVYRYASRGDGGERERGSV